MDKNITNPRKSNSTDFVKDLLNGKILPENIGNLFIPTLESLKGLVSALQEEIASSSRLSKDLKDCIDSLSKGILNLIADNVLSEEEKSKALDLIKELAQMIKDSHDKEQAHKHEIKKLLIQGLTKLGTVIGFLTLGVILSGSTRLRNRK